MPCASSLPPCTSTTSHSQTSAAPLVVCAAGVEKDAPLPLRLCARRAFVLAIICILFITWPLLVYSELAEAGLERPISYYGAERCNSSRELSTEALLLHDVTEQKSSTERISKFQNRKFLRQGAEVAFVSTKEFYPATLSDISPEGILQLSSGNDEFPGRDANPNRRMLIPATNVCTNKDISISQGPDGSSGIPRYFVQIVNTCMSDCAPSQVHVSCGWFASALLVNPNTFRRLAYNDCLVNGGKPLKYGEIVRSPASSSRELCRSHIVAVSNTLTREVMATDLQVSYSWRGTSNECSNKDISITQRRDGSPGMPRFSVQIVNMCVSDCAPADVHVFCGWFASSPPPNPNTFQRLAYNDCLVNGGRPLGYGAIIQFQYANSFMYPIRFRSAKFCR